LERRRGTKKREIAGGQAFCVKGLLGEGRGKGWNVNKGRFLNIAKRRIGGWFNRLQEDTTTRIKREFSVNPKRYRRIAKEIFDVEEYPAWGWGPTGHNVQSMS